MNYEERCAKARDYITVWCENVNQTSVYEFLDIDPYDDDAVPNDDAEAVIGLIRDAVIVFQRSL